MSPPLTPLPHGHMSDVGRNQPADKQGAAAVPGVRQAAVRLHPAPPGPFQTVLCKQGLDFLGARVVPGPHRLLLEDKATRGRAGERQGSGEQCGRHLSQVRPKTEGGAAPVP